MRHPSPLVARLRAASGEHPARGVLGELRRAIVSGDAPPGSAIPVGEVAQAFGVSPIPVREALQVLVGEGLVAHRTHAGYSVARLSRPPAPPGGRRRRRRDVGRRQRRRNTRFLASSSSSPRLR